MVLTMHINNNTYKFRKELELQTSTPKLSLWEMY